MIKNPAVPVIMYHSIGIPNKNWRWTYLTCHYKTFEEHLKWMKIMGFHSVSLQQLYTYTAEGRKLPKNPVALTFDDGYVDNWVFAYPLLKKYGFKSTIFVSPEFVDQRNVMRKTLENVYNDEVELNDLETVGYLSWREMKVMEEDIMDVQSHTMTHTWYPNNNIIIDFRHPGDSYIWMTWNDNPEKKPCLQIDDKEFVNYGEPVYQHGRAIGIRRFFPDENLKTYLKGFVKEKGRGFFRSKNWREKLFKVVEKYKRENRFDERFETEEEYEERIYYELQKSKEIIEDKLSKEVKFLSWPGGAVTDKALKTASEVGYILSTYSSKEISACYKNLKNNGKDPSRIKRMGSTLYWNEKIAIYLPPPLLLLKLKLHCYASTLIPRMRPCLAVNPHSNA